MTSHTSAASTEGASGRADRSRLTAARHSARRAAWRAARRLARARRGAERGSRARRSSTAASSAGSASAASRSEEHTSELQSRSDLVCRLLLEKKKKTHYMARSLELQMSERHLISSVESTLLLKTKTCAAGHTPGRPVSGYTAQQTSGCLLRLT